VLPLHDAVLYKTASCCLTCAGLALPCPLQVTQSDFEAALSEVQPAFGANTESLSKAMTHGIIDYGDAFRHLANTLRTLVSQVKRQQTNHSDHDRWSCVCWQLC
jgi:uncharacterized membrane-anchored protein YhcB (DUF1043 family)